jgi:glycine cleavage system H protein
MLELGKAVISLRTPVGGVIVAANAAAVEQPMLINTDPYGAGWLIKLRVVDWDAAKRKLVTGEAIAPAFEEAMRLEDFKGIQN